MEEIAVRSGKNITLFLLMVTACGAAAAGPSGGVAPSPATKQTTREPLEELTVASAIAKAFRNNPTIYSRRLRQEYFELQFGEAWRRMWLPSISLTANTGSAYTLAQHPGSPEKAAGARAAGTPSSSLGLNIGEYTIFNFGRDRDLFEISELEVERSRQSIREIERAVRFDVIQKVFQYKTRRDLLDATQRSVDACQGVYSLLKGRLDGGKATAADLASVEIDLLNAKALLLANQTSYSQALWDLNIAVGDPVGQRYNVKADLKLIKFSMPIEDALQVYKTNSPAVRDAKRTLEQRRAEQRLAEKNALPLPTLKFSGLTVGYNFGATGTTPRTADSSLGTTGNWNVSLGLTMSIPLVGDGGLFFARTLRAAEINTEIAEVSLRNAANTTEAEANGLYARIQQLEAVIELQTRLVKQSREVFEASLLAMQNRASWNRLDIKNALEQLRTAEISYTTSVLDHYKAKLDLANLIGVDRFPEENL